MKLNKLTFILININNNMSLALKPATLVTMGEMKKLTIAHHVILMEFLNQK